LKSKHQFKKFIADAGVYPMYNARLKRATEEPFVLLVK
jgi:hypothetical protein